MQSVTDQFGIITETLADRKTTGYRYILLPDRYKYLRKKSATTSISITEKKNIKCFAVAPFFDG